MVVEDPNQTRTYRYVEENDKPGLDHIRLFRVTTYDALKRTCFYNRSLDSVKRWVKRMRRLELIGEDTFPRGASTLPRKYYFLTAKAVKDIYADDPRIGDHLGEAVLPLYVGMMSFCCLSGDPVVKLSAEDFCEAFPELAVNKLPPHRYYQNVETAQLGYIYVHENAEARNVRTTYKKIISKRFNASQAWRDFIRRKHFVVTIVTANTDKRDRVASTIDRGYEDVPFNIYVEPLLDLLV